MRRGGSWQLRSEQLTAVVVQALGDARFGGIWIDDEDHGRLKVGAVQPTAADQRRVDAQGFRGAADVVAVPRTLADLDAAVEWLWSRALVLNDNAVAYGSNWTLTVSMSPSRSTVNLEIPPALHRSDEQRQFIEEAQARFGSMLHVEEYDERPSSYACNTTLPPYTDHVSGYSYRGMAVTTFCAQTGDSGAPVYASNTAYGLVSGGAGLCTSYYQSIVAAQNGMNVDIIVAP